MLVHGDASFHNVMGAGGRLTALLDWEFAHPGHPAEDLGYCRPAVETALDWREFLSAYTRAGGAAVTAEQVNFYSVWGRVRLITLIATARNLYLSGQAHDIGFADAATDELYSWLEVLHADLDRALRQ